MTKRLEIPSDATRTDTASIWMGSDGVVRIVYREQARQDLEHSVANFQIVEKLAKGQRARVLVDITNLASVNREARRHGASPEVTAQLAAVALLVGSGATQMIGNFFLKVNRPAYPTRLFTSVDAALAWLNEQSLKQSAA